MGEGFIVRKGGVATLQTLQPTITFVSSTTTSITFTLTNNDASTATIVYRASSETADGESVSLATGATSSNLTISGLTEGDIVTIYATANATGKIKSNVAELERGTTLATPTIAQVSKTDTSITFTVRNESNTAASVTYGLSSPPTTTTLELAANTTSTNQTISGLDAETSYTVFAQATKTNYTSSEIASSAVTTNAPPIDPATLSPQLWLDASDATTITASSGSVSQWNNKGSLGNFTQATSASQPTTGVTTLNSLNVINFDSDFLTAANQNEWKFLHDGTKYEIFSVIKIGTIANPNTRYRFFGNGDGTPDIGVFLIYDDRSSSSNNDKLLYGVNRGVSGTSAVVNFTANDYWTPNEFNILSVYTDPSNATAADRSEIRTNGGSLVNNNTQTNAVSSSNPSFALQIGSTGRNTDPLVGSIAELIIISGANVTSQNRTDLIDYLANKWGITI